MRRRLFYWYGQLKALETSIDAKKGESNRNEQQVELERIESAVSHIRFPLAFTNQVYDLRDHIHIVRRRFAPQPGTAERVMAE
jgi:hypothetical protein